MVNYNKILLQYEAGAIFNFHANESQFDAQIWDKHGQTLHIQTQLHKQTQTQRLTSFSCQVQFAVKGRTQSIDEVLNCWPSWRWRRAMPIDPLIIDTCSGLKINQ